MRKLALDIFRTKYFFIPVIATTLIIIGLLAYFYSIEDKSIFPNLKNYKYDWYTDEPNGGQSQITDFTATDSTLRLEFDLKEGFFSPYVGLSISPKLNQFINAKKYNQISLQINGKNIERIGISLFTPPLKELKSEEETLYHTYLNISGEMKAYEIPITHFQHPDWWKDLHQLTETNTNKPELEHILHLNIGSAFTSDINNKKALEISSIKFSRNNNHLLSTVLVVYFGLTCFIYGLLFIINFEKNKTTEITVNYKPLEVKAPASGDEKCIDFINRNFANSSINLELVACETGVPQRRITNIIHERYKCNFKTFINRIRISEAKRLLKESQLNMGEIAFQVGFNNQSHFNRVFKAETQLSPSEYIENQNSQNL